MSGKRHILSLFLFGMIVVSGLSLAQAPAPTPAPVAESAVVSAPAESVAATKATPPVDLNVPFTQSFLFTPAELMAINKAVSGVVSGTAVLEADKAVDIPPRRVISLSGVVFRAPGDWIVWLNGQKVTPKTLLPEIVDITVGDSSKVHLKWFDIGLNNVISITLRPHQTYDIVTGVLLPG